jgi:hypothetical protein
MRVMPLLEPLREEFIHDTFAMERTGSIVAVIGASLIFYELL